MTHNDNQPPVLIIGGGPVGLTAALLLAKLDVPTVVLERRSERSAAPRAHVINPRSLEIFRSFEFDVAAMRNLAANAKDDVASHFDWKTTGRRFGSLPFEEHDDTHTPHPRINLAQPRLERLLLDEVAQAPLIDLRVGHRVTDLVTADDAAIATVSTPDGETYEARGDYALACDGANSEVRDRLGIQMHGQTGAQPCLTIHFEADLRALVGDRPGMFYWAVGAQLPGIFIAYDIDNTWVYLSFMAPEVTPTPEEARHVVTDALGTSDVSFTVRHVIPWVMTAQVADQYRSGRIFLVGDAAHRFPPSGGLGLNTGVQDAHNLAWKIAAVRSGRAGDSLLDTYQVERQAVAEINTEQSLTNAGSALEVFKLAEDSPQEEWDAAIAGMYDGLNSLALQIGYTYADEPAEHVNVQQFVPRALPGDRLPHAWLTIDGRRSSSLDLLSPHSFTLLVGPTSSWHDVDLGMPVHVAAVSPEFAAPAEWLEVTGLGAAGAVLVRPDGHVLDRTDDDSETSLTRLRSAAAALLGV